MTSRDYYHSVLQLVMTSTIVTSHWIEFDEQDVYVAYLKGSLDFVDGSTLFFAQYVRIEGAGKDQISREKYRYHWRTMCMSDLLRRRGRVVRQTCGES